MTPHIFDDPKALAARAEEARALGVVTLTLLSNRERQGAKVQAPWTRRYPAHMGRRTKGAEGRTADLRL